MNDSKRILVVDDQRDIVEMTAAVLRSAGYRVATAFNGIEALEHLSRECPELVLLDINMPEMDGWETLRLIRADSALAALPVVMFSVKNQFRDKVQSMQEGALDYITKPFEVDELLFRVRRAILGGRRGDGPARPTAHPVN